MQAAFRRRFLRIKAALEPWSDDDKSASQSPSQPARAVTSATPTTSTSHGAHLMTEQPQTDGPTADSDGYLSHRQILVVMGGLMAGMFLAALDQSIVGTALPRITSPSWAGLTSCPGS